MSTSKIEPGDTSHYISAFSPSSKLKTYGFTIAIIIGIVGLIGGAIGLAGYFHVGTLSHMAQLDAIIMMAVGGGGGIILLIIVGIVKNRKSIGDPLKIPVTAPAAVATASASTSSSSETPSPTSYPSIQAALPTIQIESLINMIGDSHKIPVTAPAAVATSSASLSSSSLAIPFPTSQYPSIQAALPTIQVDSLVNMIGDYASEVLYGPEAWGKWRVEVLDAVPLTPKVDYKNDKVLLYIPQKIRFNGKEQNLTLKVLKDIAGDSLKCYGDSNKQLFEGSPTPGWILIDKDVIPESGGKNYGTQQKMVEERGCSLPTALEATILNFMVFDFTGKRLYGAWPPTYTRCLEKVDIGEFRQEPIVVGGFAVDGLEIFPDGGNFVRYGVACVRRF